MSTNNRVAIITGAGRGIGRAMTLGLLAVGVRVLAVDRDREPLDELADLASQRQAGTGLETMQADLTHEPVIADILAATLKRFGRVDIVVNNAGITRDAMFHKMTPQDWKAVIDVHLNGAFNVCRATIELFREQQEGAYALFTSTSGLIGNIGQSNYAAAKLGVVGLSRVVAMEGAAKGVRSNCIAPFAWTRMIASIPVKDEAGAQRVERIRTGMRADQVAPLAVALAAPSSDTNAQVFSVRGNEVSLYSQPRPIRSVVRKEGWTPDTLIEQGFAGMRSAYTDLGATTTIYPYDPV